jgi:hypothetical protein
MDPAAKPENPANPAADKSDKLLSKKRSEIFTYVKYKNQKLLYNVL